LSLDQGIKVYTIREDVGEIDPNLDKSFVAVCWLGVITIGIRSPGSYAALCDEVQ